ncbi:amino acid permease [Marinicauda salina]|uniref:Amino acid permease n=1 Tax=Marinicauda salina TaxID=2135793 RepID=A0A2U2BRI5_9PROT|nr:amino acid permease [Marinicauda salina]PWE16588.1 amino acid permease [Marinicauda salina]
MTELRRAVGPLGLSLYGIGVTVGAGIYALIGEAAGLAGQWTPLAFVIACALAGVTALSYAELSTRHPESAGEAAYVASGLRRRWLAAAAGYGVAFTGMISSATILRGFAGYLAEFVVLPDWLTMAALITVLAGVALWGVRQTVMAAAVVTLIEVAGLIFVIVAAAPQAVTDPLQIDAPLRAAGLLQASVLAFFAFIGFEDIVNMAEEARRPHRDMPIAIGATLAAALVLYTLVAWTATAIVPGAELAASGAPLARVVEAALGGGGRLIAGVALIAMVNGVLIQMVMAARVLYGLSRRGLAPDALSDVHARARTPHVATLTAAGVIAVLALSAPIATLAEATSLVTLAVFTLVNLSLAAIRVRGDVSAERVFVAPAWTPALGAAASLAMLAAALTLRLI